MYRVVYEEHHFGPYYGAYALYFGDERIDGGYSLGSDVEDRIKRGLIVLYFEEEQAQ
jgi:hypothetical protein